MLYPFKFLSILKERVWGGRKLAELYHKPLPPGVPIGESWEISDRPGDVSVIANGPLAGRDLHWLVANHPSELFGDAEQSPAEAAPDQSRRFPLLIKILDAREKLSLQVHPPAEKAAQLRGEPKTEMWYIAKAEPQAELYAGLKRGVTRARFEEQIHNGTVADAFHRLSVAAGNAMFLPSGRVHAIGAGLVIFEIQQNSDTTYRVFDWNRVGLDGKPRALHIPESLASIDFNDFEPELIHNQEREVGAAKARLLVDHPLFRVEEVTTKSGAPLALPGGKCRIVGVVSGQVFVPDQTSPVRLTPGEFCLLPASVKCELLLHGSSTVLVVENASAELLFTGPVGKRC